MEPKKIAQDVFELTEGCIYSILEKFENSQMTEQSFVYCFTKAFYIYIVKLYIKSNHVILDFEKLYMAYKVLLKEYFQTNNPTIENELLDQILNFFDYSFALIETVEFSNLEDSYELRHYTINVFDLLRMILEKKSQAMIRENIFDKDIRNILEEVGRILVYITKIDR